MNTKLIIALCNHFHKSNFETLNVDGQEFYADDFLSILGRSDGVKSEALETYYNQLATICKPKPSIAIGDLSLGYSDVNIGIITAGAILDAVFK